MHATASEVSGVTVRSGRGERPPSGSPSMATEQPTKCPSSASMRTEAQSGDAIHGAGTIRSDRLLRNGTSRNHLRLACHAVVLPPRRVAQTPAGLPSTGTEQPTKRPLPPSSGRGAESEDKTRGVGTIWSDRQPHKGFWPLASALGWSVRGGPPAALGGSAATPTLCGLIVAERMPPTVPPRPDRTVTADDLRDARKRSSGPDGLSPHLDGQPPHHHAGHIELGFTLCEGGLLRSSLEGVMEPCAALDARQVETMTYLC